MINLNKYIFSFFIVLSVFLFSLVPRISFGSEIQFSILEEDFSTSEVLELINKEHVNQYSEFDKIPSQMVVSILIDLALKRLNDSLVNKIEISETELDDYYIQQSRLGLIPDYDLHFKEKFSALQNGWDVYNQMMSEGVSHDEAKRISYEKEMYPVYEIEYEENADFWSRNIDLFAEMGGFCCYPVTKDEYINENKEKIKHSLIRNKIGIELASLLLVNRNFEMNGLLDSVELSKKNKDELIDLLVGSKYWFVYENIFLLSNVEINNEKVKEMFYQFVNDRMATSYDNKTYEYIVRLYMNPPQVDF